MDGIHVCGNADEPHRSKQESLECPLAGSKDDFQTVSIFGCVRFFHGDAFGVFTRHCLGCLSDNRSIMWGWIRIVFL